MIEGRKVSKQQFLLTIELTNALQYAMRIAEAAGHHALAEQTRGIIKAIPSVYVTEGRTE
jgi:hypothetical protein